MRQARGKRRVEIRQERSFVRRTDAPSRLWPHAEHAECLA